MGQHNIIELTANDQIVNSGVGMKNILSNLRFGIIQWI